MRHISKRHQSSAEDALDARLSGGGEYCGSCGHGTRDEDYGRQETSCDCEDDYCPCQASNAEFLRPLRNRETFWPVHGRRYSQTPLVCDKCGRTATKSVSGGLDGHTMLCSLCAGDEPEFEDISGLGVTAARADLPLADPGTVHTAIDDYPEMESILWDRPDLIEAVPVEINNISLGSKTARRVEGNDLKKSIEDPAQPWWWKKVVGPALDRVNDNLTMDNEIDFSKTDRPDNWCRFRRDEHCFLPKELDVRGTEEAGYPVWIPYDRGRCPRIYRDDQKACEVSEPGPTSGERLSAPDATYTWAQGGQRYHTVYQGSLSKSARLAYDPFTQVPPQKPGETSIPSGAVRLTHRTWGHNVQSILSSGLEARNAGDGSGEVVWAAAGTGYTDGKIGGPWQGESDVTFFEFWMMPNELHIGNGQDPAWLEQRSAHVTMDAVPVDRIVGVYMPWHAAYWAFESRTAGTFEEVLSGFYDNIGQQNPETYGKAIDYIKKGDSKTSAATQGVYWHGTMHRFRSGDTVLPADLGSHDARWPETDPSLAYAMKHIDHAWRWADKEYENHVWHEHNGEYLACSCPGPFVFEVSPLNPEDVVDEDRPWKGVQSPSGFRVNRKLDEKMTRSSLEKDSAWSDVNQKAVRIRQDGGVRIISDLGATVTAEVRGDNGLYTTTITRVPGRKKVAVWYCSCPWAKYAWDRSDPYKKLEGRKCAHATALLYEMQSQQMFGEDIQEMVMEPDWRTEEPTMDRRDGEEQVDYGVQVLDLVSSLISHDEAELALGNIHDAALLAASGQPEETYVRLSAHAAAAAEDRSSLLRAARRRHAAFSGQVGGRIRTDLELTSDGMIDAGGSIIEPQAVLYPTFDPSAGLSFFGAREDHSAGRVALLDARLAGETLPKTAAMDAGLEDLMQAMEDNDFTHAGLIIKSSASGRVLLTQRTPFHGDDEETYGKWEFPGGGLDDGEDALSGAIREFEEETGLELPEGFSIDAHYENGTYVAIVITVPDESWTVNADLLDLETMGIGWFETEMIEDSEGFVRPELLRVDFEMVREAVVKEAWDEQDQYESDMNKAFWSGQAEIARDNQARKQRLIDMKGQEIEVVKGRKVPVGTRGTVFYSGEGKWGWRIGFTDENGQEHWTDATNVELVSEMGKTSFFKGAPFAGYADFAACVAANQDKDDPEAYCGSIKNKVEGSVDGEAEAILLDEPEPVMNDGVAYGADDPEDSLGVESSTHVDAEPFVPGDPRLSHLAGGGEADANEDIAAAAAKFLKESVKTFSPAEQQMLIEEGGYIGAGNDDMLQIEGTFYEDQMTDEIGWM